MKRIFIATSLLLVCLMSSCFIFQKTDKSIIVIKGKYNVKQEEKLTTDTVNFICNVYNAQDSRPLTYAILQIKELNIEKVLIDKAEPIMLHIPPRKYQITISAIGNNEMLIRNIKFKEDKRVLLSCFLGSTVMY